MTIKTVYEIGMLINPNLSQQGAEKTIQNVKNILDKNSASVISEGEIVEIDLAYQIITKIASKNERFNEAFFSWIKLETEAQNIQKIKEEIDKIKSEIFRFLITKTVRDDEETDKFQTESDNSVAEGDEDEIEEEQLESDDLTKIEGVGPKTAEVLNNANIETFSDLADTKVGDIRVLLEEAGLSRYDPKTWPKQAELARNGEWEKLKELQDKLNGGEILD